MEINLTSKREWMVYDLDEIDDQSEDVTFAIGPLEVTMDLDEARSFSDQLRRAADEREDYLASFDDDAYAGLPPPPPPRTVVRPSGPPAVVADGTGWMTFTQGR